jgi:hypothetical protein
MITSTESTVEPAALRDVLVQRELESRALGVSGLKRYDLRVPLLCCRFVLCRRFLG